MASNQFDRGFFPSLRANPLASRAPDSQTEKSFRRGSDGISAHTRRFLRNLTPGISSERHIGAEFG
jgi:hypothetical protein